MTTHNSFDDLWDARLKNAMLDNWTGNVSDSYTATSGFLQNMINRIGRTIVTGADNISNPFSKWTDMVMDYGDTIQKYTLGYLDGYKFDPEADDPFTKVKNPPIAQYAKFNESMQYQNTIDNTRLQFAFTNAQNFGDFTSAMVNSIYESSGLDKFLKWKKYLTDADYVPAGNKYTIDYDSTDEDDYAFDVLKKIKDISKMAQFPNDKNMAGRLGAGVNFDVIMTYKTKNMIDKALSGVYNMEKLDIPNVNFIYIDEFGTQADDSGNGQLDIIMADSRMMHYTPRTPESGAIYNPKGRYTNYFYTEEGIYSFDLFRDAFKVYQNPDDAERFARVRFLDSEDYDSEVLKTFNVPVGSKITYTDTPSHAGETFKEWTPEFESGTTVISGDTDFVAVYNRVTRTTRKKKTA